MDIKDKYSELERRLIEANNRAEQAEKLIDAFLSNVSHEIRTPLNSILGFSELMKEDDLSEDEREEYFGYIDNKCNYLLNFVDNVIDLARIESNELRLQKANCNINIVLEELFTEFESELKKFSKEHIKLILNNKNEVGDLTLYTDCKRIKQVISNLLTNAIKFTNKGYIEFGYILKDLSTLHFYVKDTGIGLPEDKFKDIFEKFTVVNVALSKKIGGAGLGLTISKHLIEIMGGEIWLDSEEGNGSTFFFSLPIEEENIHNEVFMPDLNQILYNWHDKTILVADDFEMNFMFIEAALRKTKVKILWAKDGNEAIDLCRKNINGKSSIDLVLMDIQMPNANGYEATKQIKEIKNDLPVISHTAFDMDEEMDKSIEAGCDDYLPKPVTPDALITKLSKFLVSA